MRPSKLFRATAFAALIAFLPACSALFVQAEDSRPVAYSDEGESIPDCTQVPVAPMLDSAVGVVGVLAAVLGTVGAIQADEDAIGGKEYPALVGVTGAVVALVFGGSAKYGFEETSHCQALHAPLKKVDHALATGAGRAPAAAERPAYLP